MTARYTDSGRGEADVGEVREAVRRFIESRRESGVEPTYKLTDPEDVAWLSSVSEEHGLLRGDEAHETASAEDAERQANKLLGALKDLRDHKKANWRMHTEEVQRAAHWLSRVNDPLDRRESFLLALLRDLSHHVPFFGKAKSRDLPRGRLGWRSKPKRLAVDDPAAALTWAKAKGLPVEVKETVPHATLAAEWKESKTVPPGCVVVPAEESFYAEPVEVW